MLNTIGSTLVSFFCIGFIISAVGLKVYGLWAFIFISQGIGSLLVLGVPKSLVQNMAHKKDNFTYWFGAKNLLYYSLAVIIGFTVLTMFIFVGSNTEFMGLNNLQSLQILISLSFCCMSSLVMEYSKGFFEAINKVYLANIYSFFQTVVLYISACIAISYNADLVTIYLVTTAAFFIIAVLSQAHIIAVYTGGKETNSVASLKSILVDSRFFFGFGFITGLFIPLNRLLIATSSGGAVSHGIFDIGLKISLAACSILNAFSTNLHAYFRSMIAKGKDTLSLINFMTIFLFLLYVFGLVTFYFISEIIMSYFSLESSALKILFILLISIAFTGVCEPALKALWSKGEALLTFRIKILQLVLNLMLFLGLYSLDILLRVTLAYCIPLVLGCLLYIFLVFSRSRNES